MSEQPPVTGDAQSPDAAPSIILPKPEGHRRGALVFRNGANQAVDLDPDELADTIRHFLADSGQLTLELQDAQYGDMYLLTRTAVERELLSVCVAYIANPVPRPASREIVLAHQLPNRAARRHGRN